LFIYTELKFRDIGQDHGPRDKSAKKLIDLRKEIVVNYKQRIVLIIGAACLIYFLSTSPKISIVKGTYVIPASDKENVAKMIDVRTAMTRAVAILGATVFVFFALKNNRRNRTLSSINREALSDENHQLSDQKLVKRDTLARIFNFLKNFF
jgi:hypothetical protein